MPEIIIIKTSGRSLTEITSSVQELVKRSGLGEGVASLFIQHTSASLVIQENADPDVGRDLIDHFDRLAPENAPYRHTAEGPDDMPAHIKSALTATSLTIPISNGALMLGTWQGVYLFEHRKAPHTRRVIVTFFREG